MKSLQSSYWKDTTERWMGVVTFALKLYDHQGGRASRQNCW